MSAPKRRDTTKRCRICRTRSSRCGPRWTAQDKWRPTRPLSWRRRAPARPRLGRDTRRDSRRWWKWLSRKDCWSRPRLTTPLRGSMCGAAWPTSRRRRGTCSLSSSEPPSQGCAPDKSGRFMWLIRTALRRPITVVVIVIGVALCSILAVMRMRTDIFPNLNLPVIYVAQPYGGMSPAQMEGYLVYYYEYHFLYVNGIQSVEDKSIQGSGLLKLTFYPGTNMSEALAQTIAYVNRARSFMPPGTVSPFVIRFDAGTVPVGYVVFSSETRTVGEIQDLALNRIRPVFATLPGLTSPPPFGGNQRTVVVTVNPDRLRAYSMSPDEVVQALNNGNALQPAGNVRTGSLLRIAESDSVAPNIQTLADLPVRTGSGPAVY